MDYSRGAKTASVMFDTSVGATPHRFAFLHDSFWTFCTASSTLFHHSSVTIVFLNNFRDTILLIFLFVILSLMHSVEACRLCPVDDTPPDASLLLLSPSLAAVFRAILTGVDSPSESEVAKGGVKGTKDSTLRGAQRQLWLSTVQSVGVRCLHALLCTPAAAEVAVNAGLCPLLFRYSLLKVSLPSFVRRTRVEARRALLGELLLEVSLPMGRQALGIRRSVDIRGQLKEEPSEADVRREQNAESMTGWTRRSREV